VNPVFLKRILYIALYSRFESQSKWGTLFIFFVIQRSWGDKKRVTGMNGEIWIEAVLNNEGG
jgi:hypothetical protein